MLLYSILIKKIKFSEPEYLGLNIGFMLVPEEKLKIKINMKEHLLIKKTFKHWI
jgi:hypothetical protein